MTQPKVGDYVESGFKVVSGPSVRLTSKERADRIRVDYAALKADGYRSNQIRTNTGRNLHPHELVFFKEETVRVEI